MQQGIERRESGARHEPELDAVVIGAGFAGLYAVHKLTSLGYRVRAYERGDDVGGVWYWNRYPGARCDCESYYYSYSFSDELQKDWNWSLRYSEQSEILDYLHHVADRFDLRRHITLGAVVESAVFDEPRGLWTVRASNGDEVTAQFVISAAGCLSSILKPDIPGLEGFEGDLWYTAAWPHEGVDFAGQRVGIIGTGASGVQAIPRIAQQAKHLTVFQRTANWVLPVWNAPTKAEFDDWVKAHYDEIRQKCRASPGAVPFDPPKKSALEVSDEERRAIFEEFWGYGGIRFFSAFIDVFTSLEANDTAAEFIRSHIRKVVTDPQVAERLIPHDHPVGTKRPPIEDNYYESFNRQNVTLVDIGKSPIIGIEGRTLATADDKYELDALVLATGFDAITGALLAIDIRGRGGAPLRQKWSEGARTYLGLGMADFPNLFTVTGPLSPSVHANMPTAVEQHVDWIADCMSYMRQRGVRVIEVDEAAEREWVDHATDIASKTLFMKAKSWYLGCNIPGKPRQFGVYVGGFGYYKQRCDAVAADDYQGFHFETAP